MSIENYREVGLVSKNYAAIDPDAQNYQYIYLENYREIDLHFENYAALDQDA